MKKLMAFPMVLVLLVAVAGCLTPNTTSSPTLVIMSQNMSCQIDPWGSAFGGAVYYDCHVTGTVKNTGSADATWVEVYVDFNDNNSVRIDSCSSYIGDLRAGQSAYYDVSCFGGLNKLPATFTVWSN